MKYSGDAGDYVTRAHYRMRLRDWQGAAADVDEANKADATNESVKAIYPLFERKELWLPAVEKLEASIAKDPKNTGALLDEAELLSNEGFFDPARDDIAAALKADPKSFRARVWGGVLAWQKHDEKRAGEVMELNVDELPKSFGKDLKAADASPDPEVRAEFLLKYKQPWMAFQEVKGVDGSVAKGRALLALDDIAEAGPAVRRAVEAHPQDAAAWEALAQLELESGNNNEAIAAAERSLKLKPSDTAEETRRDAQTRLGKK